MREDRGAATILIAALIVGLVASVGMALDISNLTYQRSRVQNSVDTAALAIARDCALDSSSASCSTSAGRDGTATYFAQQNSGGGAPTVTPTGGAKSLQVQMSKSIGMNFLQVVGISSKTVSARATATWGDHPISGAPVLPLGIGYCTWINHPPVTAGATPQAINLRTDTLETLTSLLSGVTGLLSGLVPLDSVVDSLFSTDAQEDPCNYRDEAGNTQNLLEMKGAIWLAGLSGVLLNTCEMNVSIDVTGFVGSIGNGLVMPAACTSKFGTTINKGSTILLPVYVPSSNLQKYGLKTRPACASITGRLLGVVTGTVNSVCVEVPPKIGVDIVGFAPFKVTGWNFGTSGSTYSPDPNAPACPSLSLSLPLRSALQTLVNAIPLIGGVLWLVVRPLLDALNNGGNLQLAVGCTSLQGYFVKSLTKDPLFQYGPDGADLGATNVRLSE